MKEKLIAAIALLDTGNNDHWTNEGLPRLDVLKGLAGMLVTREDIKSVMPGLTRETYDAEMQSGSAQAPDVGEVTEVDIGETLPSVVNPEAEAQAKSEISEAEQAVAEAQEALESVKSELQKRNDKLDKLIKQTTIDIKLSHANNIKTFQAAQAKQRADSAARRIAMAQLIEEQK